MAATESVVHAVSVLDDSHRAVKFLPTVRLAVVIDILQIPYRRNAPHNHAILVGIKPNRDV